MELLGTTLPEIALEKAGIFKINCPVILAPQPLEIMNILKTKAAELECTLFEYKKDWHVNKNTESLTFTYKNNQQSFPIPSLKGEHQLINAGTALATLYALSQQFPLSTQAMNQGIAKATWPGRLQQLPEQGEVWLDGAHNAGGSQVLTNVIKDWETADPKPLYLIFGMLQRKSIKDFLQPMAPHISKLFAVTIEGEEDCYSPQSIVKIAAELGISSVEAKTPEAALHLIRQEIPGRILICGSLYLIGNVLKKNGFSLE
jgi:dihydrofolate synthase/folylpolyglutamate synthase